AIFNSQARQFPQIRQAAMIAHNCFALFPVHVRPFRRGGLNRRGIALWLPSASDGISHGILNLFSTDVAATICYLRFEQSDNFPRWQMCVKMPGDTKEPGMNTFTGTGRRGKHVAQKIWKFSRHASLPPLLAQQKGLNVAP
ncbi:MAG: hypothetical protein ACREDS_11960, partial [Limisphaerales bacterium]